MLARVAFLEEEEGGGEMKGEGRVSCTHGAVGGFSRLVGGR